MFGLSFFERKRYNKRDVLYTAVRGLSKRDSGPKGEGRKQMNQELVQKTEEFLKAKLKITKSVKKQYGNRVNSIK